MVYSKYAGTELKVSGTEYVILKVRMFPDMVIHPAVLWRPKPHAEVCLSWALVFIATAQHHGWMYMLSSGIWHKRCVLCTCCLCEADLIGS